MFNDENDVGYRKPPVHSQFKKGRSGNPRGRPKQEKNPTKLLQAVLDEQMVITENGRPRKVSKLLVSIKQLVNKAVAGDLRAMQVLLKYSGTSTIVEDMMTEAEKAAEGKRAREKLLGRLLNPPPPPEYMI